jgi:hypothetical protein
MAEQPAVTPASPDSKALQEVFIPGLVSALMAEQPADPVGFLRTHLDAMEAAAAAGPGPGPLDHQHSAPWPASPVDAAEMALLRAEVDELRRENDRLRTTADEVAIGRSTRLTCCNWNLAGVNENPFEFAASSDERFPRVAAFIHAVDSVLSQMIFTHDDENDAESEEAQIQAAVTEPLAIAVREMTISELLRELLAVTTTSGGGPHGTAAAAAAAAAFAHVSPNGEQRPFSAADNALIADARDRGLPTVRISDVARASGAVLQFEVRFGAAARSERLPQGSSTGMCQVNLANGNTRTVCDLQLPFEGRFGAAALSDLAAIRAAADTAATRSSSSTPAADVAPDGAEDDHRQPLIALQLGAAESALAASLVEMVERSPPRLLDMLFRG